MQQKYTAYSKTHIEDPDVIGGVLFGLFDLLSNNVVSCVLFTQQRATDIEAMQDSDELNKAIPELLGLSEINMEVETNNNPLFFPSTKEQLFGSMIESDTGKSYFVSGVDFLSIERGVESNDANVVRSQKIKLDCKELGGTFISNVVVSDSGVPIKHFDEFEKHFKSNKTLYVIN